MARRVAAESLVRLTRPVVAKLALKLGERDRTWWDAELPGFGYRLRGDRGTWVIRPPRGGGRSSLITLGSAGIVDVAEARKAAREQLAQAALGQDVRAARQPKQVKTEITVREAFDRYKADALGRLRPSTLANLRTHLDKHWRGLHALPLASVRRADVAEHMRKIALPRPAGSGPQAALRARRTLSTVYAWSVAEGLTEANPVIGTNVPAVEVRRARVLSDEELKAVWNACPASDDFGKIVRLLILTGARRDEVAAMRWSELDLAAAVWRLPASRTKNKRPHEVHLSTSALDIIGSAPRHEGRDLVFGMRGPFSGFSKAKGSLNKQLGFKERWVIHDLRRTAATGAAKLGTSMEVVERALNHVSGAFSGIVGVYQRQSYANERREALDRWAAHVAALVNPT